MKKICQYCGQEYEADGGLAEAMSLFERCTAGKPIALKRWNHGSIAPNKLKQSFLQLRMLNDG
jgi:hypothetical protein